ncbi:ABC transporter permease [Paenibacillus arenilitoris]|uniref:Sugar ABC transporter permease n=1 Tax=Paenibacillus arenilitoris TaxID=2772299 RepID=A0A927CK13_9BACL|nr:ABC transporter permease subunit [Paenibacillus arenilitoris]MBD2868572.1 sugar ABC transporter permease [Paenibacillus arenilitoris]
MKEAITVNRINSAAVPTQDTLARRFRKQISLQTFVLLGMAFLLVFSFAPLFGILMAFKDYSISTGIKGIFTSEWVGLRYFHEMTGDYMFPTLVRNTIVISLLKLVISFPVPILLAIMINEVRNSILKRFVQTVSYLPHFISWVVVVGMSYAFFSTEYGLLNNALMSLGLIGQPLDILTDPNSFWGLVVGSAIWKEAGWWTIIFLAAIAGVDPMLYEAAEMDGAGRLKRIWHVTLPGMKSAIIVVLILSIGSMLGGGMVGSNFEQSMLLGNSINSEKSQIIQTYAFNAGLAEGRFAFATMIDLVQSVISVILILSSNFIARRVSGTGLY